MAGPCRCRDERATGASEAAQKQGEEARVVETERSALEYVEGEVVAEPGPLDELRDRYRLLRSQYEEKVGADALLALAKQNDDNAKEERGRLAKLLSADITEEIIREHLAGLAEPDTVDQLRQETEAKASSLQGRMGNLKGRIDPAAVALEQAEEACKAFIMLAPLQRAPSTPELAEAEPRLWRARRSCTRTARSPSRRTRTRRSRTPSRSDSGPPMSSGMRNG